MKDKVDTLCTIIFAGFLITLATLVASAVLMGFFIAARELYKLL